MAAQGRTTNHLFPYPLQTDPVDVAGDIELLAKSIDSQIFEIIGDSITTMVDGNTESGINVTFNDSTNKLNFDVSDFTLTFTGDATGSGTVTNLANTSFELTVADNSHNHTASNISDFDTAVETLVTGFILTDGIKTPSVTAVSDLLISTDDGDVDWTFKADGTISFPSATLNTDATTFNLLNATTTTINFGGAATDIQIGSSSGTTNINNSLDVDGDLNVDGGDITTSAGTFNLLNSTATTINFGGAATSIEIGAVTGTTTVNNDLHVEGDLRVDAGDITTNSASFNLLNSPTTLNFGAAASTLNLGATSGTTTIKNNLNVDVDAIIDGNLTVDGGTIGVNSSTLNLANVTATTINFGGAATDIQIGASSGTTNVNNNLDVDGNINVDGGSLTVSTSAFNLANTTATTLNIGGAATTVDIGANTGTTSVNNNLAVDLDATVTGDLTVSGGDIISTTSTTNLLNTNSTTVNAFGAATTIEIGASTGTTNINNNLVVDGNLTVNGTATTINTETLVVEDNVVLLNSNVTGTPTTNAGIEIERGTSPNVSLLWNESQDTWVLTKDGTTFYAILSRDDNEYIQDTVSTMFVHNDHINLIATYDDEENKVILEVIGGGGGGGATGSASLTDIWWLGV